MANLIKCEGKMIHDNQKVEWKPVEGYEGFYKVSNYGAVRSIDRVIKHPIGGSRFIKGKLLSPGRDPNGYMRVALCKNSILKTFKVHRIVAKAFLKPDDGRPQVNHKNGVKHDNSINNLEWATSLENHLHSVEVLKIKPPWVDSFGETHNSSIPIIQKTLKGDVIKEFCSAASAGREMGVSGKHISDAVSGRKKTAYGYIWERI